MEILILGRDDKSCFELEAIIKARGFRVKLIFELAVAQEWIRMRSYEAVLIDALVSIEEQKSLADVLWAQNPLSHLIVYNFDGRWSKDKDQARLFGADYVYGDRGHSHLNRLLEKISQQQPVSKSDLKILVVEDLDSPRDIVCFYLEGFGYAGVRGVSSAKEAIELLRSEPNEFNCIITDIRMPEMSGSELIQWIRTQRETKRFPVIVLTAVGTVETLMECLKVGASGFLVKPPKKEDMQRELARALRIRAGAENPCLATPDEVDSLREVLMQRMF